MTADPNGGQGELFVQREKRSRVARPRLTAVQAELSGAAHADAHRKKTGPVEDAARAAILAQLEPLAMQTGLLFGSSGFMVADVRRAAIAAGVLTGHEGAPLAGDGPLLQPRALAWLGSFLPGLARRGLIQKLTIGGRVQFGTSDGDRAHGNKNALWVLTERGEKVARLMVDRSHTLEQAERVVPLEP
jgi:hypothetical protein